MRWVFLCVLSLLLPALLEPIQERSDPPYIVVLGIAQDGGVPQIGQPEHPAWRDESRRRLVSSLALVDPASGRRWLFDATPDLKYQLQRLDEIAPGSGPAPGLAGIFLTHAHIGHYTGLAQLGHEGLGAQGIPLLVMPAMADFLRNNGPWDQLIRYGNVEIHELAARQPVSAGDRVQVIPLPVPHRQEYSEVVGYRIEGPGRSALFIPDIDSWEEWDASGTKIEEELARVDVAYLDGTFFADGEIAGRDMSGFPHPFISHSLDRFAQLAADERAKVRFIHLNHTNPALERDSTARRKIQSLGMRVAEELERFFLG